jgi:hypothetical protein
VPADCALTTPLTERVTVMDCWAASVEKSPQLARTGRVLVFELDRMPRMPIWPAAVRAVSVVSTSHVAGSVVPSSHARARSAVPDTWNRTRNRAWRRA